MAIRWRLQQETILGLLVGTRARLHDFTDGYSNEALLIVSDVNACC